LNYFFALSAIFNYLSYINEEHLGIMCSIARFCMKECFAMLYPYTTEVYKTIYRTLGFGWASGFGRLGAALM
jgi:hypothetical protein